MTWYGEARLLKETARKQPFLSLLAHNSIPDRHDHIVDLFILHSLNPNLPKCLDQHGVARNPDDRFALGGNDVEIIRIHA